MQQSSGGRRRRNFSLSEPTGINFACLCVQNHGYPTTKRTSNRARHLFMLWSRPNPSTFDYRVPWRLQGQKGRTPAFCFPVLTVTAYCRNKLFSFLPSSLLLPPILGRSLKRLPSDFSHSEKTLRKIFLSGDAFPKPRRLSASPSFLECSGLARTSPTLHMRWLEMVKHLPCIVPGSSFAFIKNRLSIECRNKYENTNFIFFNRLYRFELAQRCRFPKCSVASSLSWCRECNANLVAKDKIYFWNRHEGTSLIKMMLVR